jgi:hypothetical protein
VRRDEGQQVDWHNESRAFRAQLVVPEQRQLYDYWLAKANGKTCPARQDIHPTDIPRILPGISLVDVSQPLGKSRVRLAGTKLREIYEREITGHNVEDLDWGDKADYWLAAYHHITTENRPTQGIVKGPRLHKEHLVQYWLKLPLSSDGTTVNMVLGFDFFIMASEATTHERKVSGA